MHLGFRRSRVEGQVFGFRVRHICSLGYSRDSRDSRV